MIGQLCASIVSYFLRKKLVFFGVFSGILLVLILGVSKLRINEDFYAIFPQGKEFSAFNEVIQRNKLNKQVVFSIRASDDEYENLEQLETIKKELEGQFKQELSSVETVKSVDEGGLITYLQQSAFINLRPSDYKTIQSQIHRDSIPLRLEKSANMLRGPNSFFLSRIIAQDPLGLFFNQLNKANPNAQKSNYTVKDGVVYSADEKTIFFFSSIQINQKDSKEIEVFQSKLEAYKTKKALKNKGLQFDYFGTFQIAVENSKQIKSDTTLTSILSVSAILLILILYYRSVFAPFYFLLPGFFGILCGLGLVGYFNPNISAISLATSSVLLGIVLDYSFHFYTHLKHAGSVVKTVREISSPMLIGSFTTIAALGALLFTNSIVLQNFGLIALTTLSGSVLFTLLFLPVIIELLKLRIKDNEQVLSKFKLNKKFVRFAFVVISIISLTFIIQKTEIQFDSDMNNLSFHTPELKKKETFYTGIDPNKEKKLFVFSNADSEEKARQTNDLVYARFVHAKNDFGISEMVSLAPYLPAEKTIHQAASEWKAFWVSNKDALAQIKADAGQFGLNSEGFTPFYRFAENPTLNLEAGKQFTTDLGLDKFYSNQDSQVSYVTSFTVTKDKQEELKTALHTIPGVYVLDISEMAKSMLTVVKEDFNYLFLFSSLMVFFSMLVIYGRIELTLFAFLPMILGWLWIAGLTSTFAISFNFINIIVATFIFGLGDDFSIFTTDGLIQRTKTGVDSLKTYQSGIILSGITTIIGTGVLYFAKHPAIQSISLISVIGIGTILLITLFVQPSIYNFFVTNRLKKQRGPATFFVLIYSIFLFTYFFVGSLILNIILLFILIPLPISIHKKRDSINYLISKLSKSTIYAGVHVKKRLIDREKLNYKEPSIIVANHSSFLDILVILMLHPKTVILVKKWVYNSPVFSPFIRFGGYLFAEEGAENNLDEFRKRIEQGYSIVIFPEGRRSSDGKIKRFHKGAFFLAKELNVPIQPLLLLGTHEVNPKNDFIINRGQLLIKVLDRVRLQEGEGYSDFSKRVNQLMRSGMEDFRQSHATTAFYGRKVIENYLLKGPVLEWYVRVKWGMERKNFDFYNQLIGSRKNIVDMGCGYGYLSLYLHYFDSNRTITGIDYDEEKVAVAANCIRYTDQLNFKSGDIRQWGIPNSDVFILNDVLHYLKPEEQQVLLEKINDQLNENGLLIIRDGIIELENRIKNTQLTEKLSTKLFKFNKTTNDLSFLSSKEIAHFAEQRGFDFELIEHSTKTSNVLMILRKKVR